MSEEAPLQMSLSDFYNAIEGYSNQIEAGQEFSKDEYMTIGRLWNTVLYYTVLQSNPEGARFFELVRDKVLPKIVAALNMVVSRGFSFSSQELDFKLGGTLEERYRYRIKELENSQNSAGQGSKC